MSPSEKSEYWNVRTSTKVAGVIALVAFGVALGTENGANALVCSLGGLVASAFGIVQFYHWTTLASRVQRDIELRRR